MQRRTWLALLAKAAGGVVAAIVAIPSLLTALSPVLRGRGEPVWRSVGRREDFPSDEVVKTVVDGPRDDAHRAVRQLAVYVWRRTDDEVVVFSRNCTDLSCPVTYDPGSQCFFCPCHGGIFAKNGDRMAGPPKRPLYRYATRMRDGHVEIDLRSLPPMT